jgi:hypothetical protein
MCRPFCCMLGLAGLLAIVVLVGEHGLAAFEDDQPASTPGPQPPPPVPVEPAAVTAFIADPQPPVAPVPAFVPPQPAPPANQPGLAPPPAQQPPGVIPGTTPPTLVGPGHPIPGIPYGPLPPPAAVAPLQRPDGSPQSFDELLDTLARIRQTKQELERQEQAVIGALKTMMKNQRERAKALGIDLDESRIAPPPVQPPAEPLPPVPNPVPAGDPNLPIRPSNQ